MKVSPRFDQDPLFMRDFYRERHESRCRSITAAFNFESIRDAVHALNIKWSEWTASYGPSSVTLKRFNGTLMRVDVYGTIHLDVKLKGAHKYRSSVHKHTALDDTVVTLQNLMNAYAPLH